jgi:DNA-binding CsgD family transcriptional regulator
MPHGHVAYTVGAMNSPATAPPQPPRPAQGGVTAAVLAQVADALAWPLLLLQSDGAVLHANAAAWRALHLGRPLRLSAQRRVEPAQPRLRADFTAALADAAAGRHRVLHWAAEGPPCNASLTALAADDGGRVPVLVALSLAETRAAGARAYAALHGLSGAETRVLERLALGESSGRAAAALGVTAATVRGQIVALRRKTGHASVGALVQTLAALPPLAAEHASAGEAGRRG